jgi:hypothetical protein
MTARPLPGSDPLAPAMPRESVIALAALAPPMTPELAQKLLVIWPEIAGTPASDEAHVPAA